jgi:hypothetical protein
VKHQIATNLEWGSKARKQEDRQRGRNNADRRAAIAEQVADAEPLPCMCGWLCTCGGWRDLASR